MTNAGTTPLLDATLVMETVAPPPTREWHTTFDGLTILAINADPANLPIPGCRPVTSSADPMSEQRFCDALDLVTTKHVLFAAIDHFGGPDISKTIVHGTALAEKLALTELGVPLPVLTGWLDVESLAAWRSWVADRHPALFAEHEQQINAYLHLIRFRAVNSSLHGFDVVEGGTILRLIGRSRRGGTNGAQPPADHEPTVLLVDDDGQVQLSVTVTQKQLLECGRPWWIGFTADIPISSLPTGRFRIAVELEGPAGHQPVRGRVFATVGVLSASRTIRSGGKRFQILQTGGSGYTLDLIASDDTAPLAGFRWAAAMAWLDIKTFLRRRQFGGVRVARLLTRPFYVRRTIWLVGERTDTARDNGHHLFAYLRRERKDIRAYYVIERSSDQYQRMSKLGRVIPHSSLRHKLLFMHATALVDAYSIKYLVPQQWDPGAYARQLAWRFGAYRVYLKHGINDKLAVKRRVSGYDLYFTGVEGETIAARDGSGYDQQIVQTGLARYDALTPTPPSRTILFMPTWRSYLTPKLFSDHDEAEREFEGSDYQQFMLQFLASGRLRDLLDKHDFRLQFMPHYNLADHLADAPVSSDRIDRIGAADSNIQDIMRGCDLFVTDYSSVHFDLAYVGTPLIYTHFDREEFWSGHANASWFVHERDGFGPVAYDVDGTIDLIERYLDNGCVREDEYDERARKAFVFHDTDNCLRTTNAIERLIETHGIH